MREVTVDIMVPMTVRVDLDTGTASEAWLHLESFQDAPRGRFKQARENGEDWEVSFRDVFFSGADWEPEEIAQREVCDGEHPLADEAFKIVADYRVGTPEFQVKLVHDPVERTQEWSPDVNEPDYEQEGRDRAADGDITIYGAGC